MNIGLLSCLKLLVGLKERNCNTRAKDLAAAGLPRVFVFSIIIRYNLCC